MAANVTVSSRVTVTLGLRWAPPMLDSNPTAKERERAMKLEDFIVKLLLLNELLNEVQESARIQR